MFTLCFTTLILRGCEINGLMFCIGMMLDAILALAGIDALGRCH